MTYILLNILNIYTVCGYLISYMWPHILERYFSLTYLVHMYIILFETKKSYTCMHIYAYAYSKHVHIHVHRYSKLQTR